MKFLSYLFPQTIYKATSPYNRDIHVIERRGKRELLVNGIQQTGPYDEKIFNAAMAQFPISSNPVRSALVFGIGGGFILKRLKALFPSCVLTAVDIDTTMVRVAQEYFGLDGVEDITYIVADAQTFGQVPKKKDEKYDLIVVDIYVGDDIPSFVATKQFLQDLHALLTPHGRVLVNYQGGEAYVAQRLQLTTHAERIFSGVTSVPIFRNEFFFLSR